jgi:hypothetical protein
MVLTVSFVLSPATNSFCHRRLRIKTCLSPVGPTHLRRLSISNGCQDHTTSPYAATSPNASTGHVLPAEVLAKALKRRSSARRLFAHRPRSALRFQLRARRCRVHRIPPRVRDDREPPLFRVRRTELVEMICPTAKAIYFSRQDWTGQITLESFRKSRCARTPYRAFGNSAG